MFLEIEENLIFYWYCKYRHNLDDKNMKITCLDMYDKEKHYKIFRESFLISVKKLILENRIPIIM